MTGRSIPDFLGKLGIENNLWYSYIDEAYVYPSEYGEISSHLSSEKVVIITGTKEYGKTYTAIKLLLDYYKKGYEPIYIQTRQEDKAEVRHKLASMSSTLQKNQNQIVYFEDPFGRLYYQSDETLERDIGAIIDTIRGLPDTYVIMTSIRDFAISTKLVTTKGGLEKQILSKSNAAAMSYAEEFNKMSDDKLLFLLLLYVSDKFDSDFLSARYSELAVQLDIKRPWDISRILDWFSVDKIIKIGSTVQISHGSYSEGLEYLLHNRGYPSRISSGMFSEVLLDLLKFDRSKHDAINSIVRNIEFLAPSFVSILIDKFGKERARQLVFDSIWQRKKFYNKNPLEILNQEDKFFLFCVINNKMDESSALPNDEFRWNRVWKNTMYLENKFNENVSEPLLSIICSSPSVTNLKTGYFEKIFHKLVEHRIKMIVRERLYISTDKLYTSITTSPLSLEINSKLHVSLSRQTFDERLDMLEETGFVAILGGGRFVRGRRKLVNSIYFEKELNLHQRIVYYITDITNYIADTFYRQRIRDKAIINLERIKSHPAFEGKETLRIAAVLIFIAGRHYHIRKFKQLISYLTGVSESYISTNYPMYENVIKDDSLETEEHM